MRGRALVVLGGGNAQVLCEPSGIAAGGIEAGADKGSDDGDAAGVEAVFDLLNLYPVSGQQSDGQSEVPADIGLGILRVVDCSRHVASWVGAR